VPTQHSIRPQQKPCSWQVARLGGHPTHPPPQPRPSLQQGCLGLLAGVDGKVEVFGTARSIGGRAGPPPCNAQLRLQQRQSAVLGKLDGIVELGGERSLSAGQGNPHTKPFGGEETGAATTPSPSPSRVGVGRLCSVNSLGQQVKLGNVLPSGGSRRCKALVGGRKIREDPTQAVDRPIQRSVEAVQAGLSKAGRHRGRWNRGAPEQLDLFPRAVHLARHQENPHEDVECQHLHRRVVGRLHRIDGRCPGCCNLADVLEDPRKQGRAGRIGRFPRQGMGERSHRSNGTIASPPGLCR
jgi:hypothetical protein